MNEDSKQYKALLDRRAQIKKESDALFALSEKEGRPFTAEEAAKDDELYAELQKLAPQIDRHERRRADALRAPAFNKLPRGDDETKALAHFFRTGDASAVQSLLQPDETGKLAVVLSVPTVAEMRRPGMQAAVVDSTMNITTAADGGNTVPTGFVSDVALRKNEIMLAARLGLRNIPGKGTTVNYPVEGADPEVFASTSEQSDAHGNNYERDSGVTNVKAFTLAKKTRKVDLTEELLTDSDVNLNTYIADRIGRQMAKTHNTMLITEIAANGTSLKTFASATAIAAGEPEAIIYNDALSYYLADGGSPAWVMRPSTHGAIKALTGNPRLYGSDQGSGGRDMLGYPVAYSQAVAATAASAKDVYFGAWDQVGYREDPALRFIMDPYSVDGLVVLKYSFRAVYGVLQAAAVGYGAHPSA